MRTNLKFVTLVPGTEKIGACLHENSELSGLIPWSHIWMLGRCELGMSCLCFMPVGSTWSGTFLGNALPN